MQTTKRKIYLINPSFQLRLIGFLVGASLSPVCVFFLAHYYYFSKLRSLGESINLSPDHVFFRFINGQATSLFWIFIICTLISTVLVSFMGLMISHRIAGPLYHLKAHMNSIADGNEESELGFRKTDFFLELPPIFNRMISQLRKLKGP